MSRKAAAPRRAGQASAKTEIAAVARPPLPTRGEDLHISFSSQALFWRPHHPAASPALGQLPFLFWLIEATRPRTIVQYGIGDGVVYMALCQASERLGSGAICRGVQADEPLLSPAMRAQHDARYSDFSSLHLEDPKAVALRLGNEIDLLVLNQALDAPALASFEDDWLPLLSDRAVILVCDPDRVVANVATPGSLVPRPGRSVVLAPTSSEGYALTVILHGTDQTERLMALASQRPGDAAYLAARQIFNRLGQGMEAIQKVEKLQKERDSPRASARAVNADFADETESAHLRAEVAALKTGLAEARAAHEKRLEDIARLTAKYTDDLTKLKSDNNRLAMAKSQLETQLSTTRVSQEMRLKELEDQVKARDLQHKVERDEANRLKTGREAELSGRLDAAISEALRMHTIVAELHRTAGEELGRTVKALLASEKNGFWTKKMPVPDQARLLVDKEIVEPDWYLERHPDVAAAGMDPALHYLLHGAEEGRIPRRRLDEAARLPDMKQPG